MPISIPGAEEIAVKLNIDVTDAEKMRRALLGAGKDAHNSFLHGDSAAKGFKKTLHELSEQVPALGWALRAIVSPLGAAFAGLAAGIGLVSGEIEKLNKKLDETAAKNAEPINSPRPSKWRGIYRVRDAMLGNDPSTSGISNEEAKRQAEAVERWEQSKQNAADMVKAREQGLAEAKAEYKKNPTPQAPWYNNLLRGIMGNNMMTGALIKYDPVMGPAIEEAKSDIAYRDALKAIKDVREAKDRAAKLEGEPPHTISRGLWGMLGLKQAAGMTMTAQAPMQEFLRAHPPIDSVTGGFAYRGIGYKPIEYNPIKPPGSDLFGPIKINQGQEETVLKASAEVLAMLKTQLGGDGIIVTGKE